MRVSKAAAGGSSTGGPIRWQYFLSVSPPRQCRKGYWHSEAVSLGSYGGRKFTDKFAKTKDDHLRYVQGVDRMLARWVLEDAELENERIDDGLAQLQRDRERVAEHDRVRAERLAAGKWW